MLRLNQALRAAAQVMELLRDKVEAAASLQAAGHDVAAMRNTSFARPNPIRSGAGMRVSWP
jgi:hypothetical protein